MIRFCCLSQGAAAAQMMYKPILFCAIYRQKIIPAQMNMKNYTDNIILKTTWESYCTYVLYICELDEICEFMLSNV